MANNVNASASSEARACDTDQTAFNFASIPDRFTDTATVMDSPSMASASTPNSVVSFSVSTPSAAPPAPPSMSGTAKPPRILACVLCQNRKIKCDRNFPCSNCIKARVKCTPSTPAPPRRRKRPHQDLQERLSRCEKMLGKYMGVDPELLAKYPGMDPETLAGLVGAPGPSQGAAQPHSVSEDTRWQPAGKLVKEDGNMRFVDNPLLGVIYDEVRAMREIVDNAESDYGSPEPETSDDNSDLLLGGDKPGVRIASLWPKPAHIFQLWQFYLDRVNPLTKIIHVPTLQPLVVAAAAGPDNVPKNAETLLFAIFLMAVVSLTPDECTAVLGCSREEALQRFSSGVRLNLLRMNFLRTSDLTVLQALVIYLISLQGRYNRHAVWVLNGVAIRIAQKMGLHRDGEALGLSPFDTEMRRRLWWQIIMVDAKYGMLSGLSHNLLPTNCDTKSPKNVNDADIHPTATEPFQDREGPTEMIFGLLAYKFAKFIMTMPGFEGVIMLPEDESKGGLRTGPTEQQHAEYRRGVRQFHEELVVFFDKYCDRNAGPVHDMAVTMSTHLLNKLKEIETPPKEQPEWGSEVKSAKDNTFKHAIATLEHNEANYASTKDKGFVWFSLLAFQLDVFMYVAGQLCRRLEGTLVERAWKQVAVVYTFHPELFDMTNKNYSALALHILKAWGKREQLLRDRHGAAPETPFYIVRLRAVMPNIELKDESGEDQTPMNLYTSPDFTSEGQLLSTAAMGTGDDLDGFLNYFESPMDWDMFGSPSANITNGNMGAGSAANENPVMGNVANGNAANGQAQNSFGPIGMWPLGEW